MDSIVKNREIFKYVKSEEFSPRTMRILEEFSARIDFGDMHTRAVTFTMEEFSQMMEINTSDQLWDAIMNLQKLFFRVFKNNCLCFYHIFDSCKYIAGEERGYIELRASVEAFPLMIANDINKGEFEIII